MNEKKTHDDPNGSGSTASSDEQAQLGNLAIVASGYVRPKDRKPYDHTITFEEYNYYAQRTREEEKSYEAPSMDWKALLFSKKDEKKTEAETSDGAAVEGGRADISDEEWVNASRIMRLTSWGSCEWIHKYSIMMIDSRHLWIL